METDCVLCDWKFAKHATPGFVYRAGGTIPLKWVAEGPREISLTDSVVETIPSIAAVAHWADAHPEQLQLAVGEFEVDTTMRWAASY